MANKGKGILAIEGICDKVVSELPLQLQKQMVEMNRGNVARVETTAQQ